MRAFPSLTAEDLQEFTPEFYAELVQIGQYFRKADMIETCIYTRYAMNMKQDQFDRFIKGERKELEQLTLSPTEAHNRKQAEIKRNWANAKVGDVLK